VDAFCRRNIDSQSRRKKLMSFLFPEQKHEVQHEGQADSMAVFRVDHVGAAGGLRRG
jgi:hypothetical protein